MKILVATEKPFAKEATNEMKAIAQGAGVELVLLEKYTDVADFHKAVADVDGLIVRSDKVTKDVVAHANNLKVVVRAGAGYDNLDLAACSEKNIVCMNTPGQNSNAVAELAIAMMIYMSRNQFTPGTGSEIKGKRFGIQGMGNISRLAMNYAKAFGMELWASTRTPEKKAALEKEGVKVVNSVEELYAHCDFVSIHIPANDQTKGSINYNLMSKMPKGACIINTARKEVINEADLERVLAEREDLKYATDIAAGNDAVLKEKFGKRYFATPKKMGAETAEANINAGLAAVRQSIAYLKEGNDTFRVN